MTQQVIIWGPNVPFADGVTFHVHAVGCADLRRGIYPRLRPHGDQGGWVETHDSVRSIVESTYADQIEESGRDWTDGYRQDFHVFPCVTVPEEVTPVPEPFGPRYQERTQNGSTGDECAVCGRQTSKQRHAVHVRVVDGGSRFATPDEVVDEAGDMGSFPVGSECAKAFPKAYVT